jgi:hypothetical protein
MPAQASGRKAAAVTIILSQSRRSLGDAASAVFLPASQARHSERANSVPLSCALDLDLQPAFYFHGGVPAINRRSPPLERLADLNAVRQARLFFAVFDLASWLATIQGEVHDNLIPTSFAEIRL